MVIPRQHPKPPKNSFLLFITSLLRNRLIEGPDIERFEEALAQYLGMKHAILLGSARAGLYLTLKVLGVGKGDEIILPSYTCSIVPGIIVVLKAKPVFIDSDPETFNMNPKLIESRISSRTKAIILTHIEGHSADWSSIMKIARKYNLKIIEDCAQAVGAKYKGKKVGSLGEISYLSFATGKQVKTMGGGVALTNNDYLAREIKKLREIFFLPKQNRLIKKFIFTSLIALLTRPFFFSFTIYPVILLANLLFKKDVITRLFEDPGVIRKISQIQIKYSNFQAQLGLEELRLLDKENEKRIANAEFFNQQLKKTIGKPRPLNNTKSVYLYYSICLKERDRIQKELLKRGIDTQPTWNCSCSHLKMFKSYQHSCPVAERLEREVFYLPIYSSLKKGQLKHIAKILNNLI